MSVPVMMRRQCEYFFKPIKALVRIAFGFLMESLSSHTIISRRQVKPNSFANATPRSVVNASQFMVNIRNSPLPALAFKLARVARSTLLGEAYQSAIL